MPRKKAAAEEPAVKEEKVTASVEESVKAETAEKPAKKTAAKKAPARKTAPKAEAAEVAEKPVKKAAAKKPAARKAEAPAEAAEKPVKKTTTRKKAVKAAPAEEKVLAGLDLVALQREDDHAGEHAEIAEYHKPVNPRQHLFRAPFPCLQKKYSKTAAMQPSPKRVTIGKSPAESLSRGGKPGRITSHGGASANTDSPRTRTMGQTP